jgi:peptide chain release factor 1
MMPRELLFSVTKKDFRVDYFRPGGHGGQKVDKSSVGARITHIDSGAVGESRESRSREQNKKKAFQKLLNTREWKAWYRIRKAQALGQALEIEESVDKSLAPENLKVEVKEKGRWVTTQL